MKDSKKTTLTIGSVISKMDRYAINCDHPLQRESEQYSRIMQSNLISDILQDNPIPELVFAEQTLHDAPVTWILDGKQRCTTIKSFASGEFSISKNVERYEISYAVPQKDEDGMLLRDDNGVVVNKTEVCDIRGKKFKNLPKELQESFLDYHLSIVLYYDCSESNLAYHIKRYNAGKAMNTEQKGVTRLGTHNASVIRNISSMSFFSEGIGNYTPKQFESSKILRIITESIMTSRFLDSWKKTFDSNCDYIKENINADDFEAFKGYVEELEENVEPTVGKMFNDTDSFLWFGLYAKFKTLGLDVDKFNEFMLKLDKGIVRNNRGKIDKKEPMSGICIKEIDGTTFEEVFGNSSTKDVNIVKTRIDFLTKLACDYFGMEFTENTPIAEPCEKEETECDILNNETSSDERLVINNAELQDFTEDFSDIYSNENIEGAIESLMLLTNGHNFADFKKDTLQAMIKWYEQYGNKKMLDDCLSYKSYVEDAGIENDDPNIPFYIWAAKYISDKMEEDIELDVDISEWMEEFSYTAFDDTDNLDSYNFEDRDTVELKKAEVINKFREYINTEEDF